MAAFSVPATFQKKKSGNSAKLQPKKSHAPPGPLFSPWALVYFERRLGLLAISCGSVGGEPPPRTGTMNSQRRVAVQVEPQDREQFVSSWACERQGSSKG